MLKHFNNFSVEAASIFVANPIKYVAFICFGCTLSFCHDGSLFVKMPPFPYLLQVYNWDT